MASSPSLSTPQRETELVIISKKWSIKPESMPEESKKPYCLTPWDLYSMDAEYGQFCLLFNKPDHLPTPLTVDHLKSSLAIALRYFFPLSGRFVTENIRDPPSYCVYVDSKDSPGAGFVDAVAPNLSLYDILAPIGVPADIIKSLFGVVPGTPNNQGHTLPLLAVQVTRMSDGICIAFSINHGVADGTSFWQFINCYSEICRSTHGSSNDCVLSCPPTTGPCFLNNHRHILGSHSTDVGFLAPLPGTYRERVFRFTSEAIARLKAKANAECHTTGEISSYQALGALIWRSATRARGLRGDQTTTCAVPINCRSKLKPPLSSDYFGNCYTTEFVSSTVDELLSNNLGWAAGRLHHQISNCDDKRVRAHLEQLIATHHTIGSGDPDPGLLYLGSSPRLDVYGNDFGWGNPVAVRGGDMGDGYVHIVPGWDRGSVDLMMCFFSRTMHALELDEEFVNALSSAYLSKI